MGLELWKPEGDEIISAPGDGLSLGQMEILNPGTAGYFRFKITDEPVFLAQGGGDVLGYTGALDEALALNGGVTPADFPARYPGSTSLPGISFDATQAEYWTEWNTSPADWNAALPANSPDRRLTDFRHRTWITMLEELEELTLRDRALALTRGLATYLNNSQRIPVDIEAPEFGLVLADARLFINAASYLAEGYSPPGG